MRFAPPKAIDPSETRTLRRFAWYPRTCPRCGVTYWLEWVLVHRARHYFYSELSGVRWPFYTDHIAPERPR